MSDDENNGGDELHEQNAAEDTRQESAEAGDASAIEASEDQPESAATHEDMNEEEASSGQGDTAGKDAPEDISNVQQNVSGGDATEAVSASSKMNSREDDDRYKLFTYLFRFIFTMTNRNNDYNV